MAVRNDRLLRVAASVVASTMLLAACGETSLGEVGQRSTDWIGDVQASSTSATTLLAQAVEARVAGLALSSAAGIEWVNDSLTISDPGLDAASVAGAVWRRSGRADAYVQAHRADIASALPGVKFPGAIPASVEHVTSQLVYRPNTGRLASDVAAAFGLWSVQPYSQSRVVGQQAVLLVGLAGEPSEEIEDPCVRVQLADALACRDLSIDGQEAAEFQVEGGVRFVWWDEVYRYELFYRTDDEPEVGLLMAESMVELAHIEEQAFEAYRGVAGRPVVVEDTAPTK